MGIEGHSAQGCLSRHRSIRRALLRKKGPRRRPVRIEFCEADILDAFDEWRRAVGVGSDAGRASDGGEERAGGRPRESLATHLDRVVARLVARRGGPDRSIDAALDEIVRELDAARVGSKSLRGGPETHYCIGFGNSIDA